MQYAPPDSVELEPSKSSSGSGNDATTAQIQPVVEHPPQMVTPLEQVGSVPVDVDCPFCKKVVRTEVRKVDADNAGMMQCLICLVCWPMLFCYQTDKDINHHCSVPTCRQQLTHQPHGGRPQPVARAQGLPAQVASKYQQS